MLKFVVVSFLVVAVGAGPPLVKTRAEIEEYIAQLVKLTKGDGLTLEQRMAKLPYNNAWESSGKYQGDILLDDPLIEDMANAFATNARSAYIIANTKWPSNTAVYEFGVGEFDLAQQRWILTCMEVLSEHTCVRYRQRTASDRNYVRMTGNSDGCYAHVGYWSGRPINTLNLARAAPGQGCLDATVVVHEWLHAFGFFHMHSTHDRDDYVRIHWENIQNGQSFAFDRYDSRTVSNLGIPYEYTSCMHYESHAFSANGRPTISPTRVPNAILGPNPFMTGFDVLRLARHYNCPGAWSAEAMEKARKTIYVPQKDGTIKAQEAEMKRSEVLHME